MTGNGQSENQQQPTREKFIKCPKCGEAMRVVEPEAVIINHPKFSSMTAIHEEPQACKCGNLVQCVIRATQIHWAWREVEVQTPAGIVAPPPGFRLT